MSMVLKYLRKSYGSIILVVLLLFVKVIADLTLPQYTSNIVNIGIQQGGIVSTVPQVISSTLMERVIELGNADEKELILQSYTMSETEYLVPAYVLKGDEADLRLVFSPILATIGMGSDAHQAPLSIMEQAAIATIRADHERLGIDIGSIQNRYIGKTGLAMIGISAMGVIASIMVAFFASKVAALLGKNLREDVFYKVVSFSQDEMDSFSTASLVTRSTNDIQQIQQSFVMILRVVIFAPLMAIGGILRVLGTNSSMSWTIGVAVLAIFTVVITMFALAMPRFKRLQELVDTVNRVVRETLTGLQVIRAFNTQAHEQKRFEKANKNLTATTLFVNRAMSAMMPLMMLIMNLTTVLIVWRGGIHIQEGTMQVGDMMAFIQYAMLIIMSFLMITMLTIMLPRASVSATRIKAVLETPLSVLESVDVIPFIEPVEGTIRFVDVGFTYHGATSEAVSSISFEAKPGTTTAIIGSTGSGKSTLLNLIPRFHDVTNGSIEIDGVDIRKRSLHDLRKHIGYVPQQGRLFSGTIASNISFGDETLSDDQITNSAKIAQAHQFIIEKPEGYNSAISQGGTNVSGGQRQRLAIARAIAGKPKILLFDDSFSALDFRTENRVRKQLSQELADSTIIVVAQRISSIMHADTILVLDEGRLVGKGTHRQLMMDCPIYRQIAQSQLSPEEIENHE
ncbi:ABC transporter ATP-binding protein [Pleomorphochaeta sp. DL1XJH-081]|uniref:ABC transporter ATP-binding protein n=1 Tax=Pleomorphochaeta sp. DL1XJH-081 TaxID=3409690 RepID=UPI003BB4A5DA